MEYRTPKDVLERANELRESSAQARCYIALRECLGAAYANGKQWVQSSGGSRDRSDTRSAIQWNEDWDIQSSELRVVDNQTGPLFRRIAASTNATKIEASVNPPKHLTSTEFSHVASVAKDVLNGIGSDAMFTHASRDASSLRWLIGSSILFLVLSQKKKVIDANILRAPDGTPIEVNDQWLRWDFCPLSDMAWEGGNTRRRLEYHHSLVHERVLTLRQFEQIYGNPDDYGFDRDKLPKLSQIAPHKVSAAGAIGGTSIFANYSANSNEKALRVSTLYEADPNDPGRWPLAFTIIDTTASPIRDNGLTGTVVNFDNPETPFGSHGLPLVKLDGFSRDDSIWSWGAPHIIMGHQDMKNILQSIKFQQLTSTVFGHWLIDKKAANREEFAGQVAQGVGGILTYNSNNGQVPPPQWVQPPAPGQDMAIMGAELDQAMRNMLHTSGQNLGIAKSHVPQDVAMRLLEESGVVFDTRVQDDTDAYSDLLTTTLGTIRLLVGGPNRMIARLRDRHGFTEDHLQTLYKVDPINVNLVVRVRKQSIVRRSDDERVSELNNAYERQIITPSQYISEMDRMERPLVYTHELQINHIEQVLAAIIDGQQFDGMPNLDYGLFEDKAKQAMFGLSYPTDIQKIARIQVALVTQAQLAAELAGENQEPAPSNVSDSSTMNRGSLFPREQQGAPESINPLTNPIGAAGGLRLGLA